MRLKIIFSQSLRRLLALLPLAGLNFSCEQNSSLYENIPTEIVTIAAHSHSAEGYQPMPDSLQLRFNPLLRLLRINVVSEGCGPSPQAQLTVEANRVIVQFDMKNSCVHVLPEFFDVDINLSPVHANEFQLIVEEKDLEKKEAGRILIQRQIDVRKLPGI